MISNQKARRYILRLLNDGTARVTIPRRGSMREAWRFVCRNVVWLEKQFLHQKTRAAFPSEWKPGSEILFRGAPVLLATGVGGESGDVRFADQVVRVEDLNRNMKPEIEAHLWKLASRELPARTLELAKLHNVPVRRVTVRNQRSRWGSCSRRGTISLNWRLVQAPSFVRDYIMLHELAHLKEMNHSPRFWREVERLCADFRQAELWLKHNSRLLL